MPCPNCTSRPRGWGCFQGSGPEDERSKKLRKRYVFAGSARIAAAKAVGYRWRGDARRDVRPVRPAYAALQRALQLGSGDRYLPDYARHGRGLWLCPGRRSPTDAPTILMKLVWRLTAAPSVSRRLPASWE